MFKVNELMLLNEQGLTAEDLADFRDLQRELDCLMAERICKLVEDLPSNDSQGREFNV